MHGSRLQIVTTEQCQGAILNLAQHLKEVTLHRKSRFQTLETYIIPLHKPRVRCQILPHPFPRGLMPVHCQGVRAHKVLTAEINCWQAFLLHFMLFQMRKISKIMNAISYASLWKHYEMTISVLFSLPILCMT